MLDNFSRRRINKLVVKITSSPMLPILGWSKCVESIIAGGDLISWIAYSIIITIVWVFADDLAEYTDILD